MYTLFYAITLTAIGYVNKQSFSNIKTYYDLNFVISEQ